MIDIQHEKEATLHVNVHNEKSRKRKDMNKMSEFSLKNIQANAIHTQELTSSKNEESNMYAQRKTDVICLILRNVKRMVSSLSNNIWQCPRTP